MPRTGAEVRPEELATWLSQGKALPVDIRDAARGLLASRLGRRGRPLRLIGVTASNLVRQGEGQGQLFPDPGRERQRKLDRIMDQVHGKFGPMLRRGTDRK